MRTGAVFRPRFFRPPMKAQKLQTDPQLSIPEAGRYILARARVPAELLVGPVAGAVADTEGALLLDVLIDQGRIAGLFAMGAAPSADRVVDLRKVLGFLQTRSPDSAQSAHAPALAGPAEQRGSVI